MMLWNACQKPVSLSLILQQIYNSCQALVRRSITLGGAGRDVGPNDTPPAPSLRRRPSSPTPPTLLAPPRRPLLATNIQGKHSRISLINGHAL